MTGAVLGTACAHRTAWLHRAWLWGCVSAFAGFVAFEWYLARTGPQVPYMDSLRFIWHIDGLLTGQLSWSQIWNGGEHRGLLFPFVHLIEWLGWGLDARVSTRITGLVVLVTFGTWLHAWAKGCEHRTVICERRSWVLYAVPLAGALLAFSPAGFELWLLDLGLAQSLKNFLLLGFLMLWSIEICRDAGVPRRPWLGFAGAVLTLTVAYGWSYPFTLAATSAALIAVVSAQARITRCLFLIAPLLVAQIAYVLAGHGVLTHGTSVLNEGGAPALLKGVLLGAGSVIVNYETAMRGPLGHLGLMLLGIVPLGACAFQLTRISVDGFDAWRLFHVSAAVFGLGTLAATSFSRAGDTAGAVAASRYFVDYQWFVLGALGLACDTRRLAKPALPGLRIPLRPDSVLHLNRLVLITLLVAVIVGHLATWQVELTRAGARAAYFERMRTVFLAGVTSEQDAALLQAPLADAQRGVDVAQRYALGPYRALRAGCSLANASYFGDWHAPESDRGARWLGRYGSVLLSGCATRLDFDVYLPAAFPARAITVSSSTGAHRVELNAGQAARLEVYVPPNQPSMRVEFHVDTVTVPRLSGFGADDRALGVLFTGIRTSAAR